MNTQTPALTTIEKLAFTPILIGLLLTTFPVLLPVMLYRWLKAPRGTSLAA
jgi:ABC-type uncharacterized transport system permease subunit